MDYGKFRYEQSIREKRAKSQVKNQQMKEIQLRPVIAENDLQVKLTAVKKFLESGNKVQIKIKFTNRENAHKELGFTLINKIIVLLNEYGKPINTPKLDGKWLSCMFDSLKK
jgi:translation initiation factor IF-3